MLLYIGVMVEEIEGELDIAVGGDNKQLLLTLTRSAVPTRFLLGFSFSFAQDAEKPGISAC